MRSYFSRTVVGACAAAGLAGCLTTTPQADGSTKVKLEVPDALKPLVKTAPPVTAGQAGYDANAGKTAAAATATPTATAARDAGAPALPAAAKAQLEQALACTSMSKGFAAAESALKRNGWTSDQGVTPVTLSAPVKVFGFSTNKIAVFRDGGEHMYISFLPGVTVQQAVKAAGLKLGKDRSSYGRATKLGVLTAGSEDGETVLTCTVDTEGAYP